MMKNRHLTYPNFFVSCNKYKENVRQKDIIKYLKASKNCFAEQFNVLQIGLFGSYSPNQQTKNSDIDIIIDMPNGTESIIEKA